eukprot:TRINITY_DN22840_c0_g1_i1.p2 TRINITY_DN22840_c0_g1~~TRINITY_DN22840_c0_g1_i1.p2  ORF type:complete len:395 (+),score=144.38 TRINITY_DN22840_c0_g1_i1:81-1265(+)
MSPGRAVWWLAAALGAACGDDTAGYAVRARAADADGHRGVSAAVVDSEEYGGVRFMKYGDCLLGGVLTMEGYEGESLFNAFAVMGRGVCRVAARQRARPDPPADALLVLGLGAGTAPRHAFEACGFRTIDAVENSTVVAEFARAHFGYPRALPVALDDARRYIFARGEGTAAEGEGTCADGGGGGVWDYVKALLPGGSGGGAPRLYSVVLQDLYMGWNPLNMLTQDAFARVERAWLARDGVHIVNFVGYSPTPGAADAAAAVNTWFARSVAKTLRTVYAAVRCFRDGPLDASLAEPSNIICFAARSSELLQQPTPADPALGAVPLAELPYGWHQENFHHWEVLREADAAEEPPGHPASVLTPGTDLGEYAASLDATAAFMRRFVRGFLPEALWV